MKPLIFSLVFLATWSLAKQPNILFIFTDDHAPHAISAYGSELIQTPNLDRIAKEGALFTHSFNVNSICCPSRAAILTGKHSQANGVIGNSSKWNGSQWDGQPWRESWSWQQQQQQSSQPSTAVRGARKGVLGTQTRSKEVLRRTRVFCSPSQP